MIVDKMIEQDEMSVLQNRLLTFKIVDIFGSTTCCCQLLYDAVICDHNIIVYSG